VNTGHGNAVGISMWSAFAVLRLSRRLTVDRDRRFTFDRPPTVFVFTHNHRRAAACSVRNRLLDGLNPVNCLRHQ
jgi:hypothetical protein